jgi:hypothetical protein
MNKIIIASPVRMVAMTKAMVMAMVVAMAMALVEEMQLGIAGAAIQGGDVELENEGVKEAVMAERKDSGRP